MGLYLSFICALHSTPVIGLCAFFSALLQYFFLVTFMSMTAEAINLYFKLVVVLGYKISHYVIKAVTFSWGKYDKCKWYKLVITEIIIINLFMYSATIVHCCLLFCSKVQELCQSTLVSNPINSTLYNAKHVLFFILCLLMITFFE